MYNGIINVYKEPGFTSHDVVAKLRGITHQKKIGHTGTLDPAAVGVLLVCLGAATHLCDMLTDETKEYEAILLLGTKTDTQDTTGTILEQKSTDSITEASVREVINQFIGTIEQIPPMYSALKVGGRKLYDYARAGVEIERKPRTITIQNIDIVAIDLPRVTMRVTCSRGTYIRTLCNDIGEKLGCGGTMEHLIRTRVGRFRVEDAIPLSEIQSVMDENRIDEILISPMDMFDDLRTFTPNERGERMASNGNVLAMDDICISEVNAVADIIALEDQENVKVVKNDGFFYGVYKYNEAENILKPVKMFFC